MVALVFKYMMLPTLGPINYILRTFGLPTPNWLGGGSIALWSIVIMDVWQWTPFIFVIIYAGLSSLPSEPFEAARIYGASAWQTFRHLTLPMLKFIISIAVILRMIDALKIFDYIWFTVRGGPGTVTEVLSVRIFLQAFRELDLGKATSLGILLEVITMIIAFLYIGQILTKERTARRL